jgi:Cu/Ag efflux protein CusF
MPLKITRDGLQIAWASLFSILVGLAATAYSFGIVQGNNSQRLIAAEQKIEEHVKKIEKFEDKINELMISMSRLEAAVRSNTEAYNADRNRRITTKTY